MKYLLPFLISIPLFISSQVTVNNNMTVTQYVQNILVGSGVTISNIQYNGGVATNVEPQVGSFNDLSSSTGLPSGMILGTGDVQLAGFLNTGGGVSFGGTGLPGNDTDLQSITTSPIFDECVIEFDFVPTGDTISFNYVFASEEYEEFVCGSFNDAFGFFLTGTNPSGGAYNAENIALIPDPTNPTNYTTTPVSINTVNQGSAGSSGSAATCAAIDPNWTDYNIFYTPNTSDDYEYDGSTVVLEAKAAVVCNQTYHIKLAIGDGFDGGWDSGVFLEAGSFSSNAVEISVSPASNVNSIVGDTAVVEGCNNLDAVFTFVRPTSDTALTLDIDILGSATNGIDYDLIADSIYFSVGQDSAQIIISTIADGIIEGTEELTLNVFSVTPCGDTIITSGTLYIVEDYEYDVVAFSDTSIFCPYDSTLIYAQASGGVSPYTYQWDNGGVLDSIYVSPQEDSIFYVTATDFCNVTSIIDSVIFIVDIPDTMVSILADTLFMCVFDTLAIDLLVTEGTQPFIYSWDNGETTEDINVFPTYDSLFKVSITDQCNIVIEDSVFVVVLQDPTIQLFVTNPVILEGCIDGLLTFVRPDSQGDTTFHFNIEGSATNGTDYTVIRDSITFLNTQSTFSIPITPLLDGNSEGVEDLIINYISVNQCGDTTFIADTILIFDDLQVNIQAFKDTTVLCAPTTPILLTAVVSGGIPGYQYQWSTGETGDSIYVLPTQTTTYTVIGKDTCNTFSTTDTITITFPSALESSVVNSSICIGNSELLNASVTGGSQPYSYAWSTGSTGPTSLVSPTSTTTYTLSISDICGTSLDKTITVTVNNSPINLTLEGPGTHCIGEDLVLTPTITGGVAPLDFTWSGNGLQTTNSQNGELTVVGPETGDFSILVTDACNQQETASVFVDVFGCTISIPNVITPNDDGQNDQFIIANLEFHPNTEIIIYNRWGRVVYKDSDYKNDWKGTNNSGNKVAAGTYYYVLNVQDTKQCDQVECNGFITVMD